MTNYANNAARINAERKATASRKLDHAAQLLDDGYRPEAAAAAAGFASIQTARRAANRQDRPDLAAALRHPTQKEIAMDRIEDLEFCLDHGEWPARALIRAGFDATIESAQSKLREYGRGDLAMRLTIPPIHDDEEALAWA